MKLHSTTKRGGRNHMFKVTKGLLALTLLLGFMTACNDNGGTVTRNNANNPNMLDVNDNQNRGNGMNTNGVGNRNGNLFDLDNDGGLLEDDMNMDMNDRNGMFNRNGVGNNNTNDGFNRTGTFNDFNTNTNTRNAR
jgi:hypothetical protein